MSELMTNPFDDGGFDLATMSGSLNLLPNQYGRVRQLGIFVIDNENTTRVVGIDIVEGILRILRSKPVGSPADFSGRDKKKTVFFEIPHFPLDDIILATDLAGKRQAGTLTAETLENMILNRLKTMRASHAITEEFLFVGAIKGVVYDGASNELVNLFDKFGVTKQVVNFALATETTDVLGKCKETVRHIEDNLRGDVMSHVHCLCSSDFFDALIAHPNVEKFYLNHEKAINLAGSTEDPRKGFRFGGIVFEEYRGQAPSWNGATNINFIENGKAHFFPVGTQETFKAIPAPASYLDAVNMPAQPMYAKQVMDSKGKHVDIMSELNLLPICMRPACLVEGSK